MNTLKNFLAKDQRPDFGSNPRLRGDVKTIGQTFVESKEYKEFLTSGRSQSDKMEFDRKALITSTAANGLMRTGLEIIGGPEQPMTMRDLLRATETTSNAISYIRETGFVNAAAMVGEGNLKPESSLTFSNETAIVRTLATWIPASKQSVADITNLSTFIDNRLLYALRAVEENQLLYGTGEGEELEGLMINPDIQVYTPAAGDTMVDTIRRAMTRVFLAGGYPPTGVVVHPSDYEVMELLKDTAGNYLVATINNGAEPRLFRVPVVQSTSIREGEFLTGAFGLGAQIYTREESHIQISEHHADYFIRNQIAILAEQRLAFVTYRPESFVRGTYAPAV